MTRRRVTLATLVTGLSGAVTLDNWRVAVAAVLLVALGWIACKVRDAWPRGAATDASARGPAPL